MLKGKHEEGRTVIGEKKWWKRPRLPELVKRIRGGPLESLISFFFFLEDRWDEARSKKRRETQRAARTCVSVFRATWVS